MAIGYTSVPPGDANDQWVGWREGIDSTGLTDFFNKFAAQSGDITRCNRFTVASYRGNNSFSFDLVESYGFERRPTITVTVTLDSDVRFRTFPFNPQSSDNEVETRNWLCAAHSWTRSQFGDQNMFKLSDTCPLLPDPEVFPCAPCFNQPDQPYIPYALLWIGVPISYQQAVLTLTIPNNLLTNGGSPIALGGALLTLGAE